MQVAVTGGGGGIPKGTPPDNVRILGMTFVWASDSGLAAVSVGGERWILDGGGVDEGASAREPEPEGRPEIETESSEFRFGFGFEDLVQVPS